MKEVLSGQDIHEPIGISKEVRCKRWVFFKYYFLEQYENTLRNMKWFSNNTPLFYKGNNYKTREITRALNLGRNFDRNVKVKDEILHDIF